MISIKWSLEVISKIVNHEEITLFELNQIANKYRSTFEKYGCELSLEMKWYNCWSIKQKVEDYRIPIKNGYVCFVNLAAKKNGDYVKIKSADGEADYYLLLDSLEVTRLDTNLFFTKNQFITDWEYFEGKLLEFLELLEKQKMD